MDETRFDAVTRQLATGGTSRRRLLRALGGLMAGAVVTGAPARAATAAAAPVGTAGDFCETCYRNGCVGCLGSGCPGCRDLRAAEQEALQEEHLLQEEEQLLPMVPPATCKPYNAPCQVSAECCSDFCYNGQICSFPG